MQHTLKERATKFVDKMDSLNRLKVEIQIFNVESEFRHVWNDAITAAQEIVYKRQMKKKSFALDLGEIRQEIINLRSKL